jgi:hypothetical protein
MKAPTDEEMKVRIGQSKAYSIVILKKTAKFAEEGAMAIVWEHGRRNFQLKDEGLLPIVCPATDGTELSGVGIFVGTPDEVKIIMDGDPGVQAGIFTYELHSCRGFPGSTLP